MLIASPGTMPVGLRRAGGANEFACSCSVQMHRILCRMCRPRQCESRATWPRLAYHLSTCVSLTRVHVSKDLLLHESNSSAAPTRAQRPCSGRVQRSCSKFERTRQLEQTYVVESATTLNSVNEMWERRFATMFLTGFLFTVDARYCSYVIAR